MDIQELMQLIEGFLGIDKPWDYSLKIFYRDGKYTLSVRHQDTTYQFSTYNSGVEWLKQKVIGGLNGLG